MFFTHPQLKQLLEIIFVGVNNVGLENENTLDYFLAEDGFIPVALKVTTVPI